MKRSILALALAATFPVHAQELSPGHAVSFNAALTSDYRYRGISQTRLGPALQGGADFSHNPSGLYAGTWLSSIQWTKDAGGSGAVEWDLYAGKRGQLGADLSYDTGALGYVYPANGLETVGGFADANTAEVYGQIGFKDCYAKYSLSLTNLFGFADSRRSGYLDIGANIGLGHGLTLNIHAGHQQVRHNRPASYADWKLGLSKEWGIVTGALALIGTSADRAVYASPANGKFLGRTTLVANISKTF